MRFSCSNEDQRFSPYVGDAAVGGVVGHVAYVRYLGALARFYVLLSYFRQV